MEGTFAHQQFTEYQYIHIVHTHTQKKHVGSVTDDLFLNKQTHVTFAH